jgi:hypothetical protein
MNLSAQDFAGSVGHFGGRAGYESIYMKGKSDYLYEEMDADQMALLFGSLLKHTAIAAMFDGYGGAIKGVATDATAFVHRKAISSIQWYCQSSQAGIAARVASMRALYDSTRSCFSGHAYVNYPDLDLKDYATAYWGDNLARLKKIKAAADPDNLFRHAQSITI